MKIAQFATAAMSVRLLLLDQIKMLEADGHEVIAICANGPMVKDLRDLGVKVEIVNIHREMSPVADAKALVEVTRLLRRHKFDVVHTHTPKAGLLGPLAARLAGVRHIVHTIHGLLFHSEMKGLRRAAFWIPEKWTSFFSTHLLSQSREDIDVAIATKICSREKIEYLGNGVDCFKFDPSKADGAALRAELQIPATAFVVGCVGRLVLEKGFRELFEAAGRISLNPDLQDIRFVVIGPEEPEQNDAVDPRVLDKLKTSGVVRFLGWRDDLQHLYSIMNVFVLPSWREGIPRACMEASAMEVPIIATNIRGIREVVIDGVSGRLIPLQDVDALTAAICDFYAARNEIVSMGQAGRRHIIANHSQSMVLDRLRDFYRRLQNSR
jgi:glycosyltransferase involved in cell wall biosynthesis